MIRAEAEAARAGGRNLEIAPELVLALLAELDAARAAFQALRRVSSARRTEHLHMVGDPPCADCAAIAAYEKTL
jgi:hypothetical protein